MRNNLKDIQRYTQFSYGKTWHFTKFLQQRTQMKSKILEKHEIDSQYITEIIENLKKKLD